MGKWSNLTSTSWELEKIWKNDVGWLIPVFHGADNEDLIATGCAFSKIMRLHSTAVFAYCKCFKICTEYIVVYMYTYKFMFIYARVNTHSFRWWVLYLIGTPHMKFNNVDTKNSNLFERIHTFSKASFSISIFFSKKTVCRILGETGEDFWFGSGLVEKKPIQTVAMKHPGQHPLTCIWTNYDAIPNTQDVNWQIQGPSIEFIANVCTHPGSREQWRPP